MVSSVDICNRALLKIHARQISRLDPPEDTEESQACFTVYEQLRDEVLRAHPWNFAVKLATLNKLSDAPAFDYQYAYQLPADCLRVLKLKEENYRNRYKVIGDQLHTDLDGVNIKYTKRETDTTLFDPLFVSALVTRIAQELCYALAGSSERTAQLEAEYIRILREAKRRDGQEGTPDPVTAQTFVDSHNNSNYDYNFTSKYW